jgi:hypothetical protein
VFENDSPEDTNPVILLYKLKFGVPYTLVVDAIKEPLLNPHNVLVADVIETHVPLDILMFIGSIVFVGTQLSIMLKEYVPADKFVTVYSTTPGPNEMVVADGDNH